MVSKSVTSALISLAALVCISHHYFYLNVNDNDTKMIFTISVCPSVRPSVSAHIVKLFRPFGRNSSFF